MSAPLREGVCVYKQCKTKQSAQRQQQIGKNLIELLKKKPYAKISVSELCRESYISRNVFYKYFDSIEDVFIYFADELIADLQKFVDESSPEGVKSFRKDAENYFIYWYEHREILDLIIDNNLLEVLFNRIIQNACESFTGLSRMSDGTPEEYFPLVVYFSIYGAGSLFRSWHNEHYETSPKELSEAFYYLLTNPLFKTEKR